MTPTLTTAAAAKPTDAGPYPGLRPFFQADAPRFFGRGRQTNQMLERLEDHRFLAVIGASGCGKSSLVHAGLLPALEQGYLMDAPPHWRMVKLRPGDAPLENLASALYDALRQPAERASEQLTGVPLTLNRLRGGRFGLLEAIADARLPDDTAVLVLVDQFEELFRYRKQERGVRSGAEPQSAYERHNESLAFVNLLLTAAAQTERPVYVVLTMRSEFLGDCDIYRGLPEAINQAQFLTPRMTREQLREAIVGPLQMFHAEADPAFVDLLLNEIGTDSDQLPLMQHALLRTWQQALAMRGPDETGTLHLRGDDYAAVGGLKLALCHHADQAVAELLGLAPEQVQGVESTALRALLKTEHQRARLRTIEILFRALGEQRQQGLLVRRVVSFEEVLATISATPGPREFDELVAVVEAFRAEGRNFLVTTPPGAITRQTMLDISHESLLRQWERLHRTWLPAETESARTFQRLLNAAREDESPWRNRQLDRALKWQVQESPTAAWSARYSGARNAEEAETQFQAALTFLAASKLKRRLRWALWIGTLVAFVAVGLAFWSARAQRQNALLEGARRKELAEAETKESRSANLIAAAYEALMAGATERAKRILEECGRAQAGWEWNHCQSFLDPLFQPLQEWQLHADTASVSALAFSPDGRLLASAAQDGTLGIVEAASGRPLPAPPRTKSGQWCRDLCFTADSATLLLGWEHSLLVWDIKSAQQQLVDLKGRATGIVAAREGSTAYVLLQADSPPGGTAALDRVVAVDLQSQTLQPLLEGPSLGRLVLHPNGKWLVTALGARSGEWKELAVWDLGGRKLGASSLDANITDISCHPGGGLVLAGTEDGALAVFRLTVTEEETVSLSRVSAPEEIGRIQPYRQWARFCYPEGDLVARTTPSGSIALLGVAGWLARGSTESGTRVTAPDPPPLVLGELPREGAPVSVLCLSPDGRQLATGAADGQVHTWYIPRQLPGGFTIDAAGGAKRVAVSPTGDRIVTISFGAVELWDGLSGVRLQAAVGSERLREIGSGLSRIRPEKLRVDFHPERPLLAIAGGPKLEIWDLQASPPRLVCGATAPGPVDWLAFSGQGTFLVAGTEPVGKSPDPDGNPHTFGVWRLEKQRLIALPTQSGAAAALVPNEDQLFVATQVAEQQVIQRIELASGKILQSYSFVEPSNIDSPICRLVPHPDHKSLYCACSDDGATATMWRLDLASGKADELKAAPRAFKDFLLLPSGDFGPRDSEGRDRLAFLADGEVRICSTDIGADRLRLRGANAKIAEFVGDARGRRIVARLESGRVVVWESTPQRDPNQLPKLLSYVGEQFDEHVLTDRVAAAIRRDSTRNTEEREVALTLLRSRDNSREQVLRWACELLSGPGLPEATVDRVADRLDGLHQCLPDDKAVRLLWTAAKVRQGPFQPAAYGEALAALGRLTFSQSKGNENMLRAAVCSLAQQGLGNVNEAWISTRDYRKKLPPAITGGNDSARRSESPMQQVSRSERPDDADEIPAALGWLAKQWIREAERLAPFTITAIEPQVTRAGDTVNVGVSATIRCPAPQAAAELASQKLANLHVNANDAGPPQSIELVGAGDSLTLRCKWPPIPVDSPFPVLTVTGTLGKDSTRTATRVHRFSVPRESWPGQWPDKPRLHVLAVEVNKVDPQRYGGWSGTGQSSNDGRPVFELLTKHAADGYQSGLQTTLVDQGATAAAVLKYFADVSKRAEPRDLLVVFFAGNGSQVPNPASGEPAQLFTLVLYDRQLRWDELWAATKDTSYRCVFIVDACHAGGAAVHAAKHPHDRQTLLLACRDYETAMLSRAPDGKMHGAFSWAVIEGLRGKADASGDGLVTLRELANYISNPQRYGGIQTFVIWPALTAWKDDVDLVKPPKAESLERLEPGEEPDEPPAASRR